MRCLLVALALLMPVTATAESRLPFLKEKVGDRVLPRPWGIGLDFYTMDQDYNIEFLDFQLQDVSLGDPSTLGVTNDVQHFDIKVDAWLLPFLNVFAVIGHVETDTVIDLSNAPIQGLPIPLPSLEISTDGSVVGLGFTLAYGGDNWFTSLTTTRTEADLGGAYDSNIDSTTIQPRIGLVHGQWQYWIGGLYLDTEETHIGTVDLPLGVDATGAPVLVPLPFHVILGGADDWNVAVGARHVFSEHADLSFEIGVGDRSHTLFNFTYRF